MVNFPRGSTVFGITGLQKVQNWHRHQLSQPAFDWEREAATAQVSSGFFSLLAPDCLTLGLVKHNISRFGLQSNPVFKPVLRFSSPPPFRASSRPSQDLPVAFSSSTLISSRLISYSSSSDLPRSSLCQSGLR